MVPKMIINFGKDTLVGKITVTIISFEKILCSVSKKILCSVSKKILWSVSKKILWFLIIVQDIKIYKVLNTLPWRVLQERSEHAPEIFAQHDREVLMLQAG